MEREKSKSRKEEFKAFLKTYGVQSIDEAEIYQLFDVKNGNILLLSH